MQVIANFSFGYIERESFNKKLLKIYKKIQHMFIEKISNKYISQFFLKTLLTFCFSKIPTDKKTQRFNNFVVVGLNFKSSFLFHLLSQFKLNLEQGFFSAPQTLIVGNVLVNFAYTQAHVFLSKTRSSHIQKFTCYFIQNLFSIKIVVLHII